MLQPKKITSAFKVWMIVKLEFQFQIMIVIISDFTGQKQRPIGIHSPTGIIYLQLPSFGHYNDKYFIFS
ncbi:hypothetical protein DCAR_0414877 [Daucus carota subsp. sativus]|uniref:Uncharacterized protein n=1 Tax=Daucus carota subsp. sativus TaxID=79200 RepID=A0A165A2S2_DAUCS|nr:hypothetical protein DCAR_0414877 [Daucus carota subsp. sativus]